MENGTYWNTATDGLSYLHSMNRETAHTLTTTTDKHELKMEMKIAEYYVSLTGMFGRQVT